MKIKFSKTAVYCSVFLLTLTLVVSTFAFMSRDIAYGGDVDADKACESDTKEPGYNRYLIIARQGNAVDNLIDCYHERVNDMFNANIKKIVEFGKSENEADLKKLVTLVTRPKDEKGNNEACSSHTDNLSTYCLSENLVIEFSKFIEGMDQVRTQLRADAGAEAARVQKLNNAEQSDVSNIGDSDTIDAQKDLYKNFGAKINRIDSEVQIAQTSIDQGLAAYHEFQFALPLHFKYKKIIDELEDYRDAIRKIRYKVDLYPITFIDVTTPACN